MEKLFKTLENRATHSPEKSALISNDGSTKNIITNLQLLDHITHVGSFLNKENVKCVGLFMDNCAQWIICDLAAARLGITLVPIPLFFTQSQIEHLVDSACVEAIITQSFMSDMLKANQSLPIEKVETMLPLKNAIMLRVVTDKTTHLTECIKVTYTSGSTGDPKGVCLSAKNIGAVCEAINISMSSMTTTNHLCVLPLATLLENIAGVYACLMHGGIVVTEPLSALGFLSNAEFDMSKLLEKIELYHVGSIILLPQMLTLLVNNFNETVLKQCSSLQFMALGG